jgi:diguanylate cyclase (GGDEF)-like protein
VTNPTSDDDQVAAETGADTRVGFWVSHIRLGFGVFLGETVAVMLYLSLTAHGPHRPILWLTACFWVAFAVAGLVSASWVASHQWRTGFSEACTIVSSLAVGAFASLDSGLDSPLCFLLFVPVAYAAIGYTKRAAILCGLSSLAAATFAAATDSDIIKTQGGALMFFAALIGVSVLSVAASANRVRLEQHELRLLAAIVQMAEVDDLTGCAVGRICRGRTDQEAIRSIRHDLPVSLLMIDVDKFKSVNDTCGHPVGDRVLTALGAVLRSNTRSFDLVGRLGVDEFAVLAPDTDPAGAVELAERIRGDFARSVEVPATLSVGIGCLDSSSPTTRQMIKHADSALYAVKRAGGNGVATYQSPDTPAPTR